MASMAVRILLCLHLPLCLLAGSSPALLVASAEEEARLLESKPSVEATTCFRRGDRRDSRRHHACPHSRPLIHGRQIELPKTRTLAVLTGHQLSNALNAPLRL
jgi:hypothetical protein